MAVLHVLEQGAVVSLSQGRIHVSLDGATLRDAPARKVNPVVAHGNIRFTTPALTFFLRSHVPVLFCSLHGHLHGMAASHALPSPDRLRAQFEAEGTPLATSLVRDVIRAKVQSSATLLRRYAARAVHLKQPVRAMEAIAVRLAAAADVQRIRGLEGIAARHYFDGLALLLAPYGFARRSTRPPRDPVNAALSYGYAMLFARLQLAVIQAGLHPEVGYLHATARRNPALVLDLMEEFRCTAVDAMVLAAFLQGRLRPAEHFEDAHGGIHLNQAGKRVLIPLFEQRLQATFTHPIGCKDTLEGHLAFSAQCVAATVERGRLYTAFALRA